MPAPGPCRCAMSNTLFKPRWRCVPNGATLGIVVLVAVLVRSRLLTRSQLEDDLARSLHDVFRAAADMAQREPANRHRWTCRPCRVREIGKNQRDEGIRPAFAQCRAGGQEMARNLSVY